MPVFIPEPRNLPELPPSPKVSIAITSYNYGSFLAECLDSCLAQTVRADEIVVVDDGSTDDTQRILQDYMAWERTSTCCARWFSSWPSA